MTLLISERRPVEAAPTITEPATTWWRRNRSDLAVLVPVLLVAAAVHAIGMFGAPQRIDDEGTYVAQAWAVLNLGELTHYTYWYDHPPLGWVQLAGYLGLTDGFGRAPNAVAAGREFMLVVQVISAGLLWLLGRRLALPRWAAAVAVGLFSLSPLAIQFHRTVYLDNIATPWLLAAFVLVLTPRRRLGAFTASAACFAIAVLTKETSLLLLPALAWMLWQRSSGGTRRYAVAVATSVFVLIGGGYVLMATVKGELVPGADHTSLMNGIRFQLGGRAASGSVFDAGSLSHKTLAIWLQLDHVLPVLAVVAAPAAVAVRRLRPLAISFLLLLIMIVRPGGYLPVPFVILMLPVGVLLIAGVADRALQAVRTGLRHRNAADERRGVRRVAAIGGAVLLAGTALTAATVAAPAWAGQLRGLAIAPLDRPMTEATSWIEANVGRDQRILTDDALWVDLVRAGHPRENVVWYYKPDTDGRVPSGADKYQWIVSTASVRADPGAFPTLQAGLARSVVTASFGTGDQLVEVRRILPAAPEAGVLQAQAAARTAAGRALAGNTDLNIADPARELLRDGRVDGALMTLLATAAGSGPLTIAELPAVAGEDTAGVPRHQALLTGVAADRADRLRALLAAQSGRFQAELVAHGNESYELRVAAPYGS
ncbi:glycosyltransferase family 39 protein [Kribbella sp. NBC_01505]|uniref:ArnT family glycosyltransferase n=1 Tax=Kribbella sp. NBC_01505 TaxID=2903580 RepID=UPI003869314C